MPSSFPFNIEPLKTSFYREMKQSFIPFPLMFLIITLTSAQSTAVAPSPPGSTNLTAILEKPGQFTIFIHLLRSTKVGDQINTQLNSSKQGLTVFAPTDGSFSSLKSGTLNSFTDEQKVELVQFHVLPSFFSLSQFQTASNPLRTQAGGSEGQFAMNVTALGNQVNITTGETNATVANTIYTDNQLSVYQVDQVLLPLSFFVPPPPPPPASSKPEKAAQSPETSPSADSATANILSRQVPYAIARVILVMAAFGQIW